MPNDKQSEIDFSVKKALTKKCKIKGERKQKITALKTERSKPSKLDLECELHKIERQANPYNRTRKNKIIHELKQLRSTRKKDVELDKKHKKEMVINKVDLDCIFNEYKAKLKLHHPNISVFGDYIKKGIKMIFLCNTCHHEWLSALNFKGCPECNHKKSIIEQKRLKSSVNCNITQTESTNIQGFSINCEIKNFSGLQLMSSLNDVVPKDIGVYFLYSKDKQLLYVGKASSSIKSRIWSHYKDVDDRKLNPNIPRDSIYFDHDEFYRICKSKFYYYFAYSIAPKELISTLESTLITTYKPIFNNEYNSSYMYPFTEDNSIESVKIKHELIG